jgi:hypothetical protein
VATPQESRLRHIRGMGTDAYSTEYIQAGCFVHAGGGIELSGSPQAGRVLGAGRQVARLQSLFDQRIPYPELRLGSR